MQDAKLTEESKESSSSIADASARARLGQNVIYFALSVIAILGVAAISVAALSPSDMEKRFAYVKDILTSLLPVLGTWVGTVLAFYFSKENFSVAAKQTSELVRQLSPDQKLQQVSVIEAMLSMDDPATVRFTLSASPDQVKLKEDIVEGVFNRTGRNRLPLVDKNGKVEYVLHRSIVDRFIAQRALEANGSVGDLTLKDILDIPEHLRVLQSFGIIGMSAKLIEAKKIVDGTRDCSDVFVTVNGGRDEKAIGWITNVVLAERAKV